MQRIATRHPSHRQTAAVHRRGGERPGRNSLAHQTSCLGDGDVGFAGQHISVRAQLFACLDEFCCAVACSLGAALQAISMDWSVTILRDAVAGRNRLKAQGALWRLDHWPEA